MKKVLTAFALTAALVIPSASFASAESVIQQVSSVQSDVVITNLGKNANDDLFASLQETSITSGLNSNVIAPRATDGQNMSYTFSMISDFVWSSSNLPIHNSGNIDLKLVQYTTVSSNPATATYQFATKDGSKKSSVIQVSGELQSKNTTITFSDVPKGTKENPVYLITCKQKWLL
jgi:hypothetical protein